jgi:hypothetical protein
MGYETKEVDLSIFDKIGWTTTPSSIGLF